MPTRGLFGRFDARRTSAPPTLVGRTPAAIGPPTAPGPGTPAAIAVPTPPALPAAATAERPRAPAAAVRPTLKSLGGTAPLNGNLIGPSIHGVKMGLFATKGFFLTGDVYDVSVLAFFLFQMVFMDTTATIPTGAMAERWKWGAFCIYGFFISMIVYPASEERRTRFIIRLGRPCIRP